MPDLTLAQRLLCGVGAIAERDDVIVHRLVYPERVPLRRWEKALPADMCALFQELNGLSFSWSFRDAPAVRHGVRLLGLSSDGRSTSETLRGRHRSPRQPARRCPTGFLQAGQLDASTPVFLCILLDDAGDQGILMTGTGEQAAFFLWSADGTVRPLAASFTTLIERLISGGFACTWIADAHPDTAAVRARLAQPAPRQRYMVRVLERADLDESDHRRAVLGALEPETLDGLLVALGLRALRTAPVAEQARAAAALLEDDAVDEAAAQKLLKVLGDPPKQRTLAALRDRVHLGLGPVACITLELATARFEDRDTETYTGDFLVRVLQGCPGVELSSGFPGAPEALRYTLASRRFGGWSPLLEYRRLSPWSKASAAKKEPFRATYSVTLRAEHAAGLVPGACLASAALPTVEESLART